MATEEFEALLLPWPVEATTIFGTGTALIGGVTWPLLPLVTLLSDPLILACRCSSCCRRLRRRRRLSRIAERLVSGGPVRVDRSCWAATLARNSTRRFLALAMALLLTMVPLRPPAPPTPPPPAPPLPAPPPPPTTALTLLVDAIARADGIAAAETVVLNAATVAAATADGRPDGAPPVAATNGGSLAAAGPPRRVSSGSVIG